MAEESGNMNELNRCKPSGNSRKRVKRVREFSRIFDTRLHRFTRFQTGVNAYTRFSKIMNACKTRTQISTNFLYAFARVYAFLNACKCVYAFSKNGECVQYTRANFHEFFIRVRTHFCVFQCVQNVCMNFHEFPARVYTREKISYTRSHAFTHFPMRAKRACKFS